MSKEYALNEGNVTRGGEVLATYNAETKVLDFLPGKAKYRAPVVRFLRSIGAETVVTNGSAYAALPDEPTETTQETPTVVLVADAPMMDPAAGDKTPAYVDWLYANYPEDAARRYAGRKTHRS